MTATLILLSLVTIVAGQLLLKAAMNKLKIAPLSPPSAIDSPMAKPANM